MRTRRLSSIHKTPDLPEVVDSFEPFEWGTDWALNWPFEGEENCKDERAQFCSLARKAAEASDRFFAYQTPTDFLLEGNKLRFTSAVQTSFRENNTVVARWYPSPSKSARAVLIVPHWNGKVWHYALLCRLLNLVGISALVVVLPFHEQRKPAEAGAAEYSVSANLGRTMEAARQGVCDIRSCADWLESRGFRRLGLIGTSLGASYGFLASAHDGRFAVNVFNHCASSVSEVIWTGEAVRPIRRILQQHIGLEQLHEVWRVINPISHVDKFARHAKRSLLITARYDTTFLPRYFRKMQRAMARCGSAHKVVSLPCGHYSLAYAPWVAIAAYHICSFLSANL